LSLTTEDELPEREEQEAGKPHSGRQRQNPRQEQVAHRAHGKPEEFATIIPATPDGHPKTMLFPSLEFARPVSTTHVLSRRTLERD